MPHCTPEQLALAALREPLPAPDAAHLESCARCRAEVASLQRGVDALAVPQLAAPGTPVPPPPEVWAAIAAATGAGTAPRPEVVPAPRPQVVAASEPPAAPAAPAAPVAELPRAPVTPLRPRRSRLLLAAAAALVVGAGIGAGAVALSTRDDGRAVAAAALHPLDDSGASGEARVLEQKDGRRVIEVDLSARAPEDGYYEVWLLDRAVSRLMSLGVVQGGDTAVFELPRGLDLGEYPVVDVSIEPLDGNPAHSGVSVARGELAT